VNPGSRRRQDEPGYFPNTPGDPWDYDEPARTSWSTARSWRGQWAGAQDHHAFRPLQTAASTPMERKNGQTCWPNLISRTSTPPGRKASPEATASLGICPPMPTGSSTPGVATPTASDYNQDDVPGPVGAGHTISGPPPPTARRPSSIIHSDRNACVDLTQRPDLSNKAGDWEGRRLPSRPKRFDIQYDGRGPLHGEVRRECHVRIPKHRATLSTAGRRGVHRPTPTARSPRLDDPTWTSGGGHQWLAPVFQCPAD